MVHLLSGLILYDSLSSDFLLRPLEYISAHEGGIGAENIQS